jgi:outer membrane protein assembly factor BamB
MRTLLKFAALAALLAVVAGTVLYAFGLRLLLDGGGGVSLGLRGIGRDPGGASRAAPPRAAGRRGPDGAPGPRGAGPSPAGGTACRGRGYSSRASRRPAGNTCRSSRVLLDRLPGARPRRPLPRAAGPSRLALRRTAPAVEAAVGGGYASFVIARGRAFTIEQRGAQEVAAAYDVLTGRELWTNRWTAAFRESMGGDGPRATPTWDDGPGLRAGRPRGAARLEEETGNTIWRTNILEDAGATNLQWGMAAAPLIVDDTVVVLPGGPNGRSIVAYDKRKGDERLVRARRSAGVLFADARHARRRAADPGVRRHAADGRDAGPPASCSGSIPWKTSYDVNASQPARSSATTACSSRPATARARRSSS